MDLIKKINHCTRLLRQLALDDLNDIRGSHVKCAVFESKGLDETSGIVLPALILEKSSNIAVRVSSSLATL